MTRKMQSPAAHWTSPRKGLHRLHSWSSHPPERRRSGSWHGRIWIYQQHGIPSPDPRLDFADMTWGSSGGDGRGRGDDDATVLSNSRDA